MSDVGSVVEAGLRMRIMDRLAQVVATNGGVVSRDELTAFVVGDDAPRRLLDRNAGIWNPRELAATLSIISSPDGPYADEEIEGGLFRYDYTDGQNTEVGPSRGGGGEPGEQRPRHRAQVWSALRRRHIVRDDERLARLTMCGETCTSPSGSTWGADHVRRRVLAEGHRVLTMRGMCTTICDGAGL